MQPARITLCLAVVVAVVMTPPAHATLSLAVLPAVASVGGLAALKVLKYVGLSRLRSALGGGDTAGLTDLQDSSNEFYDYQEPAYVRPPPAYYPPPPTYIAPPPSYYQSPLPLSGAPSYYQSPLPLSGAPAFYIVPASHFEGFRQRRDVSRVAGSGAAGIVAVSSEKEYFDVIGGLDASGCVLRAVCEVAGAPSHTLTEDEKTIMAAFSAPYQPSRSARATSRDKYFQAVLVGRSASDAVTTCATTYARCSVPGRTLLKALEEEKQ